MSTLRSFLFYFLTTATNVQHNLVSFFLLLQTTEKRSMKFITRVQFKSNSEFSPFSDSVLIDKILSKVSPWALCKFTGGLKMYD